MKKIRCMLLIMLLLCSMLILPNFTENVSAIEQHEVADGTAIGYIENNTIYEGLGSVYYCTGDIWVLKSQPDTHMNDEWYDGDLIIQEHLETYETYAYVKYNFSTIPSNASVVYATLFFYAFPEGDDSTAYFRLLEESWDADAVTWNTKPDNSSNISGVVLGIDDTIWYSVDLTDDVQSFVNGTSTNYGWSVNNKFDGDNFIFIAMEASGGVYRSYVVVSYEFPFNVTRDVSVNSESDIFNFTVNNNFTDDVNLKVPVSSSVRGIVDVTNNTGSVQATEVNSTDLLVNNTYWYDSANHYVYIRTINLTYGMTVNWTVNCSYGITFNIPIPTYKNVGEDISMSGRILNSTGIGMNVSARTHIYNSTGVDVISPVHEWYCHYGNYQCTIPTSGIIPGIYRISIEIIDPDSGITFKYGDNLYLSFETPDGVYSDALVYFNFYNTNIGLGLIPETFKVYVDDVRNYENKYYGYTGQTINITVRDYYNFIMRTDIITITETYTPLNYGLTFHEYFFTNENSEYFYASFLKEGATRWYELVVPCSGGYNSFMLPTGNYTIRVYNADNSSYLQWVETVNRSKAYLIGEDGVSLIIQGQSVIIGEFLELSEELDYVFMPDVTIISRNPLMIFSVYDKEGMAFGNDFYMICPPLITIATTRVTQYGNWINSTPMIPGNGSVLNGTITIIRDVLYLSGPGSITWVNITYMNNGTLLQNTSYIPSRIDIYGENLTINASGDILVLRVTKYNQVRKFDWMYYPFKGYGPDLERAGWHSAGIEVINPMPVPLYDVYVIAGFSDESNPDGSSVEVRDATNGGIILDRGPSYDVTDTSIHFNIYAGMAAYETRAFTIGYYKMQQESYIYDEGIVSVPSFESTAWDGGSYNYFPAHWSNPHSETFRGALYIKLNFDVPVGIDTTSMRIYDLTNDHEMDTTMFIPGDKYIRISAEGMGDVLPGGSRKFDVYFVMEVYPGADPTELHFDTPIFLGVTLFFIILIIGLVLVGYGGYTYVFTKNKDWWKGIVIGIFLIVFFSILTAMGI